MALMAAACSGDGSGVVEVVDSWAATTPPGAQTAAVYLTIENGTSDDDRVEMVAIDRCEAIELHSTEFEDGIMRMRVAHPDLLVIPAGERLEMVPGGLHVMCIGLISPFQEGEQLDVTISLENTGAVAATAPIESR